ncbi:tetratricopeptide repeat protein [Nitrosomonas sp.]|uniref:tetratricopeptide repeat protein n=1 Tax=Nitrosomonas sp. TaxID=42353 RepID=UPI00271B8C1E|nr:tetratricopeptide repeat protein [Nitrosomonas sp.]MDO8894785.1 tetratricopeptide repeat protein [Nitrosomonas sp.]
MKKALLIFLSAVLLSESTAGSANTQPDSSQVMEDAQVALASGEYEKAFAGYDAAARSDQNALAQFTLGLFYQNGWGSAIDKTAACQWFEKAAQGGIPVAQHLTGICLDEGTHRPADPTAAASWFQKAAQAGHFHSYCHLGNLLMTGRGVPKDPMKALELCRPAAQQGSIPAQLWLGKFYLQGDPAIQDKQEAYRWFTAAAEKQAPEGFYYLGILMQQGSPEGYTAGKTRQLFEQAAALNYVPAYFQTGKHFFAAEPDPETNRLPAEHLAKAYLWISAAIQRSEDSDEILAARSIRQQILAIMPETWLAELDQKIAQHLGSSD